MTAAGPLPNTALVCCAGISQEQQQQQLNALCLCLLISIPHLLLTSCLAFVIDV